MVSEHNGGAYGFRLVPPASLALPNLSEQRPEATDVAVDWAFSSAIADVTAFDGDHYLMAHRGGGLLDVRRSPARIFYAVPRLTTPAAFVHPILARPMAFLARWRGNLTLHGGAFVHDGRAWVVTGRREAGKSALLAGLAQRGVPILSDDLVVIDGDDVLAGPCCVDLRTDTAARMPEAQSIGTVGGRTRYRLPTPPAPMSVPLGGICLLEWGDGAPELTRLPVEHSLRLLHGQHYATEIGPPEPEQNLALLERPIWRFQRERDWAHADATLDHLLGALAAG